MKRYKKIYKEQQEDLAMETEPMDDYNTVGSIVSIRELPDAAQFISDSQEVQAVKDSLGTEANAYDSFFVLVDDADIIEAWGMEGIVPKLDKTVVRVK